MFKAEYSLPLNLHKHMFDLLQQHLESLNIWSDISWINTEDKSLITKWNQVRCSTALFHPDYL